MSQLKTDQNFLYWVKIKLFSLKGLAFTLMAVAGAAFNFYVSFSLDKVSTRWHLPIIFGTQAM
ncbi:MAG TPA: hypothetical protein VK400_20720, partial [Pyrinomonadaceae bacterium]|nr:hypothetical protein [Pyrinomonadaceae bacterium]